MITEIHAAFGLPELPHILSTAFRGGRRFELGGEVFRTSDPARFLQAIDRARAIAGALFKDSTTVDLFAAVYGAPAPGAWERRRIQALRGCGITRTARWVGTIEHPDDMSTDASEMPLHRHWYLVENMDIHDRDRALWASIANEMAIRPRAQLELYLADRALGLVLHAYDDRGLDAAAIAAEHLEPLTPFDMWLLPNP